MSKLSNLLLMLQYLQSGRKYSVKELSTKLEVSERQIRSYKDVLEQAGIYVDTIMGPYGGYVLNQTIRMPVRKFRKKDYELLDKYIESEKDNIEKEKLTLLQDKIKGVYAGSQQESKELNLKDETLTKFNQLTRAIKERKKVLIRYYSYNKGENDRTICPAEMFLFQDGWYVAAFCLKKNDIRHFELRRIIKLEILEETF